MIHTVKGFSGVDETEVDVFLELSCFLYDSVNVSNLISGSSAFIFIYTDFFSIMYSIVL